MKMEIYAGVILVVAVAALFFLPLEVEKDVVTTELKKFTSEAELIEFLNSSGESYGVSLGGLAGSLGTRMEMNTMDASGAAAPEASGAKGTDDFSTTNIQVEGVDEADIVKTDGEYIYTAVNNHVVIIDASTMEVASTINLSKTNVRDIYINGDRLVIFGNNYSYYYTYSGRAGAIEPAVMEDVDTMIAPDVGIAPPLPPRMNQPAAYIKVFDVTDKTSPVLSRELNINGTHHNSRMIGDYVYAVVNAPVRYHYDGPIALPRIGGGFPEVYYFDIYDYSYQFTNVVSMNVLNDEEPQMKTFLLGYSSNLFVSQNNIYMVYQKRVDPFEYIERIITEVLLPALPADVADELRNALLSDKPNWEKQREMERIVANWIESMGPEQSAEKMKELEEKYSEIQAEISKEMEKSVVHRIAIDNGNINYITNGEVPGTPLNQFSMDEHNGYFRIATTTSGFRSDSLNHMYVLDAAMNIVGKLEDLAQGERIFSARFMGDRAYMVTFVQIDPLFVIDLSDPTNPTVLGELKIPGVSDYLHPYDENHIIGIGRATDDTKERVTFSGLKVSIFDVTDVANPIESAKFELGDRGTNSEALHDHRAFLFDKEKGIIVLPVQLYEQGDNHYPDFVWQGAYVLDVAPNSITERGRVTHVDEMTEETWKYWDYRIRRSLYIGDTLYTVSDRLIQANDLINMEEKGEVELPGDDRDFIVY